MSDVKLFLKVSEYTDNSGNVREANNFFLKVGRSYIPIQVKYFPNKDTGKDAMYPGRMQLLANFAEDLPDNIYGSKKQVSKEKTTNEVLDEPGFNSDDLPL